jgi:chemotaxis protein MotB
MPRKPQYLQSDHSTRERWLISYTDIVTILLILFVAVAAQGMKARVTPPVPQLPPQPPMPAPAAIEKPRQALVLAGERLKQHGVDLRMEARGLVISLPQVILFPSGEDHVNPASLPLLSEIATELRAIPNKIALVGHADAVPIHNNRFHNNWELSAARSLNLLTLLSTQFGIAESRLSIQSYGSYSPKNPNDTEDGRAENRRVEMLILDESSQ